MSFAENVLSNCMGLRQEESLIIIYDINKKEIADKFYNTGKKICSRCELMKIPVSKENGAEPPKEVALKLKDFDVGLLITTKSLSHTDARREASAAGVRIASMPGISLDMAKRTLDADYQEIKKKCEEIYKLIRPVKRIVVKADKGTNLEVYVNRPFKDSGIYTKKGSFGNLPAGEVGFAPVEGKSNGIVVVDLSMAGIGKLKNPIKFIIKDGFVVGIDGRDEAKKLKRILNEYKDKNVYNLAEFAIGLNDKAKLTGAALEDEKVAGTVHVAIGDNSSYPGGKTNALIHLDGVISKPKIFIEGKPIKI